MNRTTVAIAALIVLVAGAFIILQIALSGPDGPLPVRVQTLNPEASTLEATPAQALYFLLYSVVVAVSLIGGGIVLALIFRFLDREIARNRQLKK